MDQSDGTGHGAEGGGVYRPTLARPSCPHTSAAFFNRSPRVRAALACLTAAAPRSRRGLSAEWKALSPYILRSEQLDTLEAQLNAPDVLSRQPTGSGKTLAAVIPIVADWVASRHERLPLIGLFVAPWRSLGFDLEWELNKYLDWVAAKLKLPSPPRALFIDRQFGDVPSNGETSALASAAAASAAATAFVCCRFEWPDAVRSWCSFCAKPSNEGTQRVVGCKEAATRREAARAKELSAAAAGDRGGGSTGGGGTSGADEKRLQLSDLPEHSPERRIAEDRHLCILVATPETLASDSERGRLLNRQLVHGDRLGRIVIDEAHACLRISAAAYREACAAVGARIASLRADVALHRSTVTTTDATLATSALATSADAYGGRPPLLCQTATLPPAFEEEAIRRLRLGDAREVVRGPVDRPTIAFVRLLLSELSPNESAASYALRAWRRVEAAAPASAREGHKLIFITKATKTRVIAAYLEANGVPASPYATNDLTDAERRESLAMWRADPNRLLVASAAFGQGINMKSVTLVVHLGLPADVLEHFQQDGRIRATGLSVTVLRARYVIERLGLPSSDTDETAVASLVELLGVLTQPWCLRAALVEWLGGSIGSCSGCDACVAFGPLSRGGDQGGRADDGEGEGLGGVDCGAFPFDLGLHDGGDAACHVLQSLGPAQSLLSELLERPVVKDSVFSQPYPHSLLVLSMIGAGHLVLSAVAGHRDQRVVRVAAAPGSLRRLQMHGDGLFVLLPRVRVRVTPGTRAEEGGTSHVQVGGDTARAAALVSQAARLQLANARRSLAAAMATLSMAVEAGVDLAEVGMSRADMALLRASQPPAVVADESEPVDATEAMVEEMLMREGAMHEELTAEWMAAGEAWEAEGRGSSTPLPQGLQSPGSVGKRSREESGASSPLPKSSSGGGARVPRSRLFTGVDDVDDDDAAPPAQRARAEQ